MLVPLFKGDSIRYYFYQLLAANAELQARGMGSTFTELNRDRLAGVLIAVPPLAEQQSIAAFLDRKTAQIDALISAYERLVALLEERRQAVITQAVTKGLDPTVPMKDSGIPWLGEVPGHWDVLRNKTLFMELDVRNEDPDAELLSVSHLTGVTRRSEKNVNMFMAETLVGYKTCGTGDLVINTMWAWMGALGTSPHEGVVSPSYNVYRTRLGAPLNPRYYDYLARIPRHVGVLKAHSTGVWESRLRLYPAVFLSLHSCVPPLDEQGSIAVYLDKQMRFIAELSAKGQKAIDLLQEYRSALITAAVTGQIDVREEEVSDAHEG